MNLTDEIEQLRINVENSKNSYQFQSECLELLEQYPENVKLRKLCGDIFLKRNKYEAALNHYWIARNFSEDSTELDDLIFQTLCLKGNFKTALTFSDKEPKFIKSKVLFALAEKIVNPQKDIEEIIDFNELKAYPLLLELLDSVKKKTFKEAIDFLNENNHIFSDIELKAYICCFKELNITQNPLYDEEVNKLPIYIQETINSPSKNYTDYKNKVKVLKNELAETKLSIINYLLGVLAYKENDIYLAIDYFKTYLKENGVLELETKVYLYLCSYILGKDLDFSFKKSGFDQYEDYYINNINMFKNRLNKIASLKENKRPYIYSKRYYSEFKLICSLAKHGEYFKILNVVEKTMLPLEERNRLKRDAYDLFKERDELAYAYNLARSLKNTKYNVD